MKVKYSSNNSGGSWWLKDEDWFALEKAGWKVEWYQEGDLLVRKEPKKAPRFLGALASYAEKEFETPGQAMYEFEQITGEKVSDEGCNCCGAPHNFSWGEGKNYGYASGQDCLQHMYGANGPKDLREAYELLSKGKRIFK